jgi:hypothetical protein
MPLQQPLSPGHQTQARWFLAASYCIEPEKTDLKEMMSGMYRAGRNFARSASMIRHMIEARPPHERGALHTQLDTWLAQQRQDAATS